MIPPGGGIHAGKVFMNALDKAIFAIRKLPEGKQEAIAHEILGRVEADARWDALFADPRCLNGWRTRLAMRSVAAMCAISTQLTDASHEHALSGAPGR